MKYITFKIKICEKFQRETSARAVSTSTKGRKLGNRLLSNDSEMASMSSGFNDQAILRRVGRFSGEQQPICPNSVLLSALKPTTFGRTTASNVRLLSCKVPLMISRKHASIIFQDEKWTIIDHNVSLMHVVLLRILEINVAGVKLLGKGLKFLQLGGKFLQYFHCFVRVFNCSELSAQYSDC